MGRSYEKESRTCDWYYKRPVPLEHSVYYSGKLYTVCTAEVYDPRGFRQAKDAYGKKHALPQTKTEAKAALPTGRGDGGRGGGGGVVRIVAVVVVVVDLQVHVVGEVVAVVRLLAVHIAVQEEEEAEEEGGYSITWREKPMERTHQYT